MKKIGKITKYLLGLLLLAGITSCSDKDLDDSFGDIPETPADGLTVKFTMTVDNMGGALADDPMTEIENYINPELFRVLFFDEDNYFLFESKSRWVTQKQDIDGGSKWQVSVPVFSYGNDDPLYDWTAIRKSLTTGKFRIAILANRPEWVVYPDFSDVGGGGEEFYYNYPNWDHRDSYKKTIFDLHHCAYDDIYVQKSTATVNNSVDGAATGFYDFLFGRDANPKTELGEKGTNLMGAVYICIKKADEMVNYYKQGTSVSTLTVSKKAKLEQSIAELPTKEKPIPMYGVQEFEPLTDWVEGTTYNLSKPEGMYTTYDYKNISLLRALVKMELLVPKQFGKPTLVAFKYGNIYARTEPLDVSTPTDQLWKNDHANCEDELIRNHKQITSVEGGNDANGKSNFMKYQSWFYAIWNTMYGWKWNNQITMNYEPEVEGGEQLYPHIFNPMVQRNKIVYLANETGVYMTTNSENSEPNAVEWAVANETKGQFAMIEDETYYRYIYYTGEKAVNDQSNLASTRNNNNSQSLREVNLCYWILSFNTPTPGFIYTTNQTSATLDPNRDMNNVDPETHTAFRGYEYDHYVLPIIDYNNPNTNPFFSTDWTGASGIKPAVRYPGLINYRSTNDDPMQANTAKNYMEYVRDHNDIAPADLPYPLLRNHVYRLFIRSIGNQNGNNNLDVITVNSEHRVSPTITFQ